MRYRFRPAMDAEGKPIESPGRGAVIIPAPEDSLAISERRCVHEKGTPSPRRRRRRSSLPSCRGCAKKLELKMTIDVLSEPAKAQVEFRNKPLGEPRRSCSTPRPSTISSRSGDGRRRPGHREADPDPVAREGAVIFRFGKEPSAARQEARRLKLLVFEYAGEGLLRHGQGGLESPRPAAVLNKQKEILNGYFPNAKVLRVRLHGLDGRRRPEHKLSLDRANAVFNYLSAAGRAGRSAEGFARLPRSRTRLRQGLPREVDLPANAPRWRCLANRRD